jgi:hypothetical protein
MGGSLWEMGLVMGEPCGKGISSWGALRKGDLIMESLTERGSHHGRALRKGDLIVREPYGKGLSPPAGSVRSGFA